MANPYRSFILTDGTTDADSGIRHEVALIDGANGICISNWNMRVAEPKGGGVWADSALADGRQLKVRKLQNVQETLTLEIEDWSADDLADDLHLLYDLLEKAANWGPAGWSTEPVWIEAIGVNETNTRYAVVVDYRTPMGGDPFQEPFWQRVLRSGMSEFDLVLEREPAWRGNYPGDSDCVEIGTYQGMCDTYPLLFNGDTSVVDLASPAALDNLPAVGGFTVEAWVYAYGWGEGNAGFIVDKSQNSSIGWTFQHNSASGLRAIVYCDVTNAISESGTDEWGTAQFGGWHHVAMVYKGIGLGMLLFIDGTQVTSYLTQQAGANNPLADAAATAYIGNINAGTRGWYGRIGWVRVSAFQRYAANFTAPARCPLPINDSALIRWVGICEGVGTTIYDLSGNANNGTATATTWGACCATNYYGNYDPTNDEREESCLSEFSYVANKHNTVGLTHVVVYDAGGPAYSANLLGQALPYNLLPAVPAVGDIIYFGIQSTLIDAGPFCSIVFDLASAAVQVTGATWEYWNGAWVALTVQDNTDADGAGTGQPFDTAGRKSVHWAQPSDWVANAINGVTALWVRVRVTGIGGAPVAPSQQNRHPYTILWPYMEIQSERIRGNVPALARAFLQNQSDNLASTRLGYNRVIAGLRSVSRGEYFSPYLNLTDRATQNWGDLDPAGSVAVSVTGVGAFVSDVTSPTGRAVDVINPAAMADVARVSLTSEQYAGTFHLFLRASQTSGVAGDVSFRIWVGTVPTPWGIQEASFISDIVTFAFANPNQLLDFGQVTLTSGYGPFTSTAIILNIQSSGNGASDARLFEVALMPVDEWAADLVDVINTPYSLVGTRNSGPTALNIDRISDVRKWHTSVHSVITTNPLYNYWQGRAPEGPILLNNTRQRLWFLSARYPSTTTAEQRSEPWVAGSVQAWAAERYLMMRGSK